MTEPITYNDLATFFSSHYGSQCETLTKTDPVCTFMDEPVEVNYLQCTTSIEDLSTFTITLPSDGINSFADLNCGYYNGASTIHCENIGGDMWHPRAVGFKIAFRKSDGNPLSAIGGFIYTESPYDIYWRPRNVLDFLGSADLGWNWVTVSGSWYTRESGAWRVL